MHRMKRLDLHNFEGHYNAEILKKREIMIIDNIKVYNFTIIYGFMKWFMQCISCKFVA